MTTGLLQAALDWQQLQGDLGRQLKFPQHIARTSHRPDMIIGLKTSDQAGTHCALGRAYWWEERHPVRGRKEEGCRNSGWRTFYDPIEVRCTMYMTLILKSRHMVQKGGPFTLLLNPLKKPQHGFEFRGRSCGLLQGCKSGPDAPWLGPLGEGVWL